MPTLTQAYTEALESALGRVVSDVRREIEVQRAEGRAMLAEMQARCVQLEVANQNLEGRLEARVRARLDDIRDGEPGRDGVDGKDADPAAFEDLALELTQKVEARLADVRDGNPGMDGNPGKDGLDGKDADPVVFEALAADLTKVVEERLAAVRNGKDGDPGRDGDPGLEGPPGKLPQVREWARGVHYAGDVVTSGGSLWQASRDTGELPGHDDWLLLAAKGQDAPEIEPRGLYDADISYPRLSIVALDGGAFIATRDNPGLCPGDGWKQLVQRGKPGRPGDKGEDGKKGGPGPAVVELRAEGLTLVALRSDGEAIACDLRPAFEEYQRNGA